MLSFFKYIIKKIIAKEIKAPNENVNNNDIRPIIIIIFNLLLGLLNIKKTKPNNIFAAIKLELPIGIWIEFF